MAASVVPPVTLPTSSPAWTTGGNRSVGTRAHSNPSSHQLLPAKDKAPMREASEASDTCSPPRAWTTQSATLSALTGGLPPCRERHASLTRVHKGEGGRPVRAENSGPPKVFTSSSASAWPRVSCQTMEEETGRPSFPSRATVSAMLVTPTPTTRPGVAASSAELTACATASRNSNGSVSAPVGVGCQGVGTLPHETSVPSGLTTAALVMVVPTSMPTSSSAGPGIRFSG